ncbi:protein kinase [Histoplasma capsulatum var. duboisii H88]|uniref:non-specific serine/threonine protein kinase n=1 Tax=Ajellomyces capsulatus (strain H88) TaxID=544711 RepID=F0UJ49_AJEC8|nr:protein kinase [Histoplasma capsulatum var. duboisii H88]
MFNSTICQTDSVTCSKYKWIDVVHKLGDGTYSSIWLAHDKRRATYVAVKVGTADAPPYEVEILHALAGSQLDHPGRAMIPTIQAQFERQGPNGCHRCYVTAPARSSVAAAKFSCCFEIEAARALVAWLVLAVAYTHVRGFIHGGKLREETAAILAMLRTMLMFKPDERATAELVMTSDWMDVWCNAVIAYTSGEGDFCSLLFAPRSDKSFAKPGEVLIRAVGKNPLS